MEDLLDLNIIEKWRPFSNACGLAYAPTEVLHEMRAAYRLSDQVTRQSDWDRESEKSESGLWNENEFCL